MTPQAYIRMLQLETGKNIKEISEKSGIAYSTLKNINDGLVDSLTKKNVEKLAEFRNCKPVDIVYLLSADRLLIPICSEESLYALSLITYEKEYSIGFGTGQKDDTHVPFEGAYYLTRNGRDFTYVDSWDGLKEEYWTEYFKKGNDKYTEGKLSRHFNSKEKFWQAVLFYGFSKIYSLGDYKKVKNYHIAFKYDDEESRQFIGSTSAKTPCTLVLGSYSVPEYLKYKNIFSMNNDVILFEDIYLYCDDVVYNGKSDFEDNVIQIKKEQYLAAKRLIETSKKNKELELKVLVALNGVYHDFKAYVNLDDPVPELEEQVLNYINSVIEDLDNGKDDNYPIYTNLGAFIFLFNHYSEDIWPHIIEAMKKDMSTLVQIYKEHNEQTE